MLWRSKKRQSCKKVSAQSKRVPAFSHGAEKPRESTSRAAEQTSRSAVQFFPPQVRKPRPAQDPAMFFADGWRQDVRAVAMRCREPKHISDAPCLTIRQGPSRTMPGRDLESCHCLGSPLKLARRRLVGWTLLFVRIDRRLSDKGRFLLVPPPTFY